jgi:hypothetical protein
VNLGGLEILEKSGLRRIEKKLPVFLAICLPISIIVSLWRLA